MTLFQGIVDLLLACLAYVLIPVVSASQGVQQIVTALSWGFLKTAMTVVLTPLLGFTNIVGKQDDRDDRVPAREEAARSNKFAFGNQEAGANLLTGKQGISISDLIAAEGVEGAARKLKPLTRHPRLQNRHIDAHLKEIIPIGGGWNHPNSCFAP